MAGIRMLVLDDEPNNNDLVKRTFRQVDGFELFAVTSVAEAFKVLEDNEIDVALIDYSMPGTTGVAFLEQARPRLGNAVTIMVTGYPELDLVMAAQRAGLVRYILAKPWKSKELATVVQGALSMREVNATLSRVRGRGPGEPT